MIELVLGTANWGAAYGAPGREALVDDATAVELAELFLTTGHDLVDTAPAYGAAQSMVGRVLAGRARVVSKLSAVPDDPHVGVQVVAESCRRLRVDRLEALLLHDAAAALASPRAARALFAALRDSGVAARAGVSVYSPAEALAAVDELGADALQVPCNLLDQRFVSSGCLRELADRGVVVHLRSVFLNGVLLAEPESLAGRLAPLVEPVRRVRAVAQSHGVTPLQLSLAFARRLAGVDAVVCGAYAADQLRPLLAAWAQEPPLRGDSLGDLDASAETATDPRTWR